MRRSRCSGCRTDSFLALARCSSLHLKRIQLVAGILISAVAIALVDIGMGLLIADWMWQKHLMGESAWAVSFATGRGLSNAMVMALVAAFHNPYHLCHPASILGTTHKMGGVCHYG